MRIYQPIWDKLKAEGTVSITLNKVFHARMIKAIVKLKWEDLEYKMELLPYHASLSHSTQGAVLTFYLKKILGNKKISPSDI